MNNIIDLVFPPNHMEQFFLKLHHVTIELQQQGWLVVEADILRLLGFLYLFSSPHLGIFFWSLAFFYDWKKLAL